MLNINLKQLEVFVTVAQLQSFTLAAQQLYITQSTASTHVRGLEQQLGGDLFVRGSKRQTALTPLGALILPRAQEILTQCTQLENLARPNQNTDLLCLAASTVPSRCLAPALMAGFSAQMPQCRYQLQNADSQKVHELLRQRTIRLGLVGTRLLEEGCTYQLLCQDKLILAAPALPRYSQLAQKGALGSQLLTEPMLCREEGSGTHQQLLWYVEQLGMDTQCLNIVARIEQPQTILDAVAQGLGVTVCSALYAKPWIDAGRILAFELQQESLYRGLYLVYRSDSMLSACEKAFVNFCRQHAPFSPL